MVDDGETPEEAVSREVLEEMGSAVTIERSDHVETSYSQKTRFCLHLYAKQLSMERFKEIERGCTQANDWGLEVIA